jgi:hypothetical protein
MEDIKPSEADLITQFYSKPFYLSYSGLNKLLYSPSTFYNWYILKQQEDKIESYLVDGKVIHCLLLDNGSFDKQFILMPAGLPGDSTRQVIDKAFKELEGEDIEALDKYDIIILEILKNINLHQKLKTDAQRLEKIITEEGKSYWEFLKIKGKKDLLDDETMRRCNDAVAVLRKNNQVSDLLGLLRNEMENIDIYNEEYLFVETDKAFGLKGIVDNIKVDHDNKVIYVNDLKTTGKTISDFKETIDYFNYWAQAAIYYRLVMGKFHEIVKDDWKVKFNFVVIDKYQQVYAFEVSEETMQMWQLKLEDNLNEAEWHYKNKDYSLPYQFATGRVIL